VKTARQIGTVFGTPIIERTAPSTGAKCPVPDCGGWIDYEIVKGETVAHCDRCERRAAARQAFAAQVRRLGGKCPGCGHHVRLCACGAVVHGYSKQCDRCWKSARTCRCGKPKLVQWDCCASCRADRRARKRALAKEARRAAALPKPCRCGKPKRQGARKCDRCLAATWARKLAARRRPCSRCGGPKEPGAQRKYCDRCRVEARAPRPHRAPPARPVSPRMADRDARIRELYCERELSSTVVGERVGCTGANVLIRLRAMGIPTRGRGGARAKGAA
jgi:hypothetical protein